MLFAYDYTFKWGLFTINAALLLKKDKKIAGLSYSGYLGGKKNEKVPGWSVPACVAGCG